MLESAAYIFSPRDGQGRSEQDRSGVAMGLAELNTKESLAMKTLVEKRD